MDDSTRLKEVCDRVTTEEYGLFCDLAVCDLVDSDCRVVLFVKDGYVTVAIVADFLYPISNISCRQGVGVLRIGDARRLVLVVVGPVWLVNPSESMNARERGWLLCLI